MILKNKFNGKGEGFFFYKRCTFLFCFLFVFFAKSQIFVSDGTVIFDKENSIKGTVVIGGNSESQEASEIKSDASKALSAKKVKGDKPKILVTKKEIIEKKIENQVILNKRKKAEFNFTQNSSENSTFINSGNTDAKSAIVHQKHNQPADVPILKLIVLHHTRSSNKQQRLLTFTYKNSIDYFYSVRPPPSFT